MDREELKPKWEKALGFFKNNFAEGAEIDIDGILFLIGVREVGLGPKKYKKDEKINLMHVGICRLLEPFGYYAFQGIDEEGWPHFKITAQLPVLKPGEQSLLMKEAIVQYCQQEGWITE